MKKVFTILTTFVLATFCLISCSNFSNFGLQIPKTVKNADVLFITNPTYNSQEKDEVWVEINAKGGSRIVDNAERAINSYKIGESRPFSDDWLNVNGKPRTGQMVYEGNHCYIWNLVDKYEKITFTNEQLEHFAQRFDEIYEKETALFGDKYQGESANDQIMQYSDKKISILLCDIENDEARGRWGGFFSPSNYSKDVGNKIELLVVDSWFYNKAEEDSLSTVVHEFNHLLNYCNKVIKYNIQFSNWYTELLSMLAEDFFKEDLGVKFENSSQSRLLTFMKGSYHYGFGIPWNNNDQSITLCYANVYAFGAYLARNYGGAELIYEIATNEYVDEESIVKAVNKVNGTNYTFEELFNEFPYILINPENTNTALPSLNKASEVKLGEHVYKLSPLNLCELSETVKIRSKDIDEVSDSMLKPYGFLFYELDNEATYKINLKNFLHYETYKY